MAHDRGNPISYGSRMEFVITEDASSSSSNPEKGKLFSKLEDPTYFCSVSDILRLDKLYYMKNLVTCLDQLMNIAFQGHQKFTPDPVKKLYVSHLTHRKVTNQLKELLSKPQVIFSK